MPQTSFIRTATSNAGAFVQVDTLNGTVDAYVINSGGNSVNIVFGAVDAADAATQLGNNRYYILGAGLALPVQQINPATTWIRSSNTTSYNTNWILSW